ncbi:hypothetical protein Sjap_014150 [Stephania japonica]|uniref:Uncharacterized protein n=1 Tax=Stephania japonica TaxID=461633 RepID=A0AAP0J139_9MAGN
MVQLGEGMSVGGRMCASSCAHPRDGSNDRSCGVPILDGFQSKRNCGRRARVSEFVSRVAIVQISRSAARARALYSVIIYEDLSDPSWAVEGQCLDEQRHLLLHFKHNLSVSSSSEYESGVPVGLSSRDLNTHCCRSWEGVEYNQIGEAIGLDLSHKFIAGSIDGLVSLFQLTHLHGLNLSNNNFNSAMPSGFDRLPNLTHLNLSNSGFVGQIPIGISRLARLVALDISTSFAGIMIPLKLEDPDLRTLVGNLSELRELGLDGVNVSNKGNEWAQNFSSSLPKGAVRSR